MSAGEIVEHAGYVRDATKLAAYESALKEVVRPDSCVLDLGAGTGILGLLAARAGARVVYAVDRGSIIGVAEAMAKANRLDDRIVHVREKSTRLDLPERADVIVCDQIGGLAYDAGVLEYFHDARTRLLAPDGVLMPGSFTLLAAPVASTDWQDSVGIWASRPAGFDLGAMSELAANTEFGYKLPPDQFLAEPSAWAEIEADHVDRIVGSTTTTVQRPGGLNAIAGMFVARLSPTVALSNSPFHPDRFERWQNLYPLPKSIEVAEGDTVEITLDIRPQTYLATWTVAVHRRADPDRPVRHRGSTVLGTFLTTEDMVIGNGSGVPRPSPAVEADRFILDLVDGERTEQAIADEVWTRHGSAFRSRSDADQRVHHVLYRHLRPLPSWSTSPTA